MRPGRSCPPELRPPAAFVDHPPSVCTSGEMVAADTLPGGSRCGVLEIGLEVRLVVLPCPPVHARGGLALKREERRPQCVDVEMVEKRSEPLFLPVPCRLPYAAQRLGHALPALGPVRALLVRVSLGPCPSLHRLRNGQPSFVRRLHSYYDRV